MSEEVTEAANTAICAAARTRSADCVDLNRWFDVEASDPTRLLAADGDHPNAAGVDVVAAALMTATLHSRRDPPSSPTHRRPR